MPSEWAPGIWCLINYLLINWGPNKGLQRLCCVVLGKSFLFSGLHIFPPTKGTGWSDNIRDSGMPPTLGCCTLACWTSAEVSPSVRGSTLKSYHDHNVGLNSDYNVYNLHPRLNSIHGPPIHSTRICYPLCCAELGSGHLPTKIGQSLPSPSLLAKCCKM